MLEVIDFSMLGQQVVVLAAAYGAVRADLKRVINDAAKAHQRMDKHIDDHIKGVFR